MRRAALALVAVLILVALAVRPQALAGSPPHMSSASQDQTEFAGDVDPLQAVAEGRPALPVFGPRRTRVGLEPTPTPDPRVVLGVATMQRLVALTFDLDMTSAMAAQAKAGTRWYNDEAVAYLRAHHVRATLFMTGLWAELYPSLARQLAQDPNFEIGNHSYSHPAFHAPCYRLGWVGRAAQIEQVRMSQQAIAWATGVTPRYFRFPGGCYDREALDLVHAAGLIPIQWNVNSIDAFNAYPSQVSAAVLSQVKPGSIVIMHLHGGPNAPSTGAALRMIVPALEQRGYQFVTITQLLAAGKAIQPTDPREIVEAYQPPAPLRPLIAPTARPTPRWCGWVSSRNGWVWVCR